MLGLYCAYPDEATGTDGMLGPVNGTMFGMYPEGCIFEFMLPTSPVGGATFGMYAVG